MNFARVELIHRAEVFFGVALLADAKGAHAIAVVDPTKTGCDKAFRDKLKRLKVEGFDTSSAMARWTELIDEL